VVILGGEGKGRGKRERYFIMEKVMKLPFLLLAAQRIAARSPHQLKSYIAGTSP